MKRTKKVLVGLLAGLSVLSGSLGVSACGDTEISSSAGEATAMEKVYAQYVVYAQAEGQTPLSYEEWLLTIKGEKGDKGDTGATGADGVGIKNAYINADGELIVEFTVGEPKNLGKIVGEDGSQGEKGEKGEKGDTGAQGEKGEKGDTGAQGEKGEKGDTGAQGEKGEQGDTGAQGEKGEKGDTGEHGEKGEKGDTGAQGEKGEKGDT
ncbi:MAG: collagen-like protein, partial [Clostridia bacterium]|nr:collagen-like protein [Clostridia bacterium]